MTSKPLLKILEPFHLPMMNSITKQLPLLHWNAFKLETTLTQATTLGLGLFRHVLHTNTDTLLGFCLTSRILDEAELLLIAIEPGAQNQGHGSYLLQQLIERLTAGPSQTLFLEVRASNAPALHLYQKLGFHCIHTRKNYYTTDNMGAYEDALVLRLNLRR